MAKGAVREHAPAEPIIRRVERQQAVDEREHQVHVWVRGDGAGLEEREEGVGGDEAAHGVCEEDDADGGVLDGGGGAGGSFEGGDA